MWYINRYHRFLKVRSQVSNEGTVLSSHKLFKKLNLLICTCDSTYGYIINKHNSIKFHKLRYQVKNRLHEPTIINQNNKARVLNRCPCPNQRCFRAFCWLYWLNLYLEPRWIFPTLTHTLDLCVSVQGRGFSLTMSNQWYKNEAY